MKKKLFSTVILIALLASVLPSLPAMASPPVQHYELIADGGSAATAVDVGDVLVWNDEGYLYVEYVTQGWYISEVHLQVATSVASIPQTKGNPVPGKFTYGEQGLWTMDYVFDPIPLSWPAGTKLYIAAHAKVWEAASLTSMNVISTPGIPVYGPSLSYYPVGNPSWGSSHPAVATWVHPSWPSISGATWISTTIDNEFPRPDSWRWFRYTFNVPGYPKSGSIVTATSDNAEEVYLNGVLVGSDGEVQGPFIDNQEWNTVLDYPIAPKMGSNTLDFIVRNYAYDTDDPHVNPTGLIYKASVEYYAREETAWGKGTPFSGKNWATYFTYNVQGWELKETISVYAISSDPIHSTTVLETGKQYKIVASGTAWAGGNYPLDIEFDAEYSYTHSDPAPVWMDGVSHYESYGLDLLDLKVDGNYISWGTYTPTHVYNHFMDGTGNALGLELVIYDIYYPNNSGFLTVKIYVWN